MAAADEALYESKHTGRNRVTATGRWTADVEPLGGPGADAAPTQQLEASPPAP